MRSHLIIDMRDRSLFCLLLDSNGLIHPFTHKIQEHVSRYFFGEILLHLDTFDRYNEKQNHNHPFNTINTEYDITRIGQSMGWLWPFQTKKDQYAFRIKHPLQVLSSILPLESPDTLKNIMSTCQTILEFILAPIIVQVRQRFADFNQLNVFVIISHYFNRRAQTLLRHLLKKYFNRIWVIYREVATMMAALETSVAEQAVILDMENQDTHLHEVDISPSTDTFSIHSTHCTTLTKSGWQELVNQLTQVLITQTGIDEPSLKYQSDMDHVLLALIYGLQAHPLSCPTFLKVNHQKLDTLFMGNGAGIPIHPYIMRMANWLEKAGVTKKTLILLGFPPMIGHWEQPLLQQLKILANNNVLWHPSLERTAYGLAAGLTWLQQGAERKIKITNHATFRISLQPDKCMELVPYAFIPTQPGETRVIKQVLGFRISEAITEDTLYLQLVWGVNTYPQYNTHVCLMSFCVNQEDVQQKRKLQLTLRMNRSHEGNTLSGSLTVSLGPQEKTISFTLTHISQEVHTHDLY